MDKPDGLRLGQRFGGADLNEIAVSLYEGGYTGGVLSDEQVADMLDKGLLRKLYAREPDPAQMERYVAKVNAEGRNRDAVNQRAREQDESDAQFRSQQSRDAEDRAAFEERVAAGPDENAARFWAPPEGYGDESNVNAPRYEPVDEEAFTPRSLNAIREYAGDQVKYGFGGKLEPGFENRRAHRFSKSFSEAVMGTKEAPGGVLPELREGVTTAHDYLGMRDAMEKFKGKLLTTSPREWGRMVAAAKKSGSAGLDAAKAAVANDYFEAGLNEKLNDRRLTTRAVEGKLKMLFADEGQADVQSAVEAFQNRMKLRRELAMSGNRMAPFSGSDSAANLAAMKDVDVMNPDFVKRIAAKLRTGDVGGAVIDSIGSGLGKVVAEYETAGTSEAFRDELGKLLMMPPEKFADVLESFPTLNRERQRAVRAVVRGLAGGGLATQGTMQRQYDRSVERRF
jgi:hypothetical protein